MAVVVGLATVALTMVTDGTVKAGDAQGLEIENTAGKLIILQSFFLFMSCCHAN